MDTLFCFNPVYCRYWLSSFVDAMGSIGIASLRFVLQVFFFSPFGGFSCSCICDHPCSSLNRPVFSMYSIVSFIIVLSPSSTLVRIPCTPTFLLSLSLSSSYNSQFSRKCFTVSFLAPHSHSEVSMILKRCRYSFRWQWPVRSLEIHTTCFRFCIAPYRVHNRWRPCRGTPSKRRWDSTRGTFLLFKIDEL